MRFASFDRFLLIEGDARVIDASHELEVYDSGRMTSVLTTEGPIGGKGIRRMKVHACVDFAAESGCGAGRMPTDLASALEGVCRRITSCELYDELVPFGPSYRNVSGDVYLSENGGMASVCAASHPAPSEHLGSPFPLDGALHVACAWGQRFHNVVAFPVGFGERLIIDPTVPGEMYFCRIWPISVTGEVLTFDISIHDSAGCLREYVRDMKMKDVSGGRVKPPQWIRSEGGLSLSAISDHCTAVSIVEIDAIADFAVQALSLGERERFERLGKRRQRSFLAGRLALKHLARKLAGGDRVTPASGIHTIMPDRIHPRCPMPGGRVEAFCSLSHDSRFAIAVAGDGEIGVDVEKISDRVLKARHIYMGVEEMKLTETSILGALEASVRVWSIKEGVSKAMDIPLAESWRQISVDDVGWNTSHLTVGGARYAAFHDTVDDHIFTLVKKDGKTHP
jgi:phosphopantetheinyl transferase (holo-ACP synthase)